MSTATRTASLLISKSELESAIKTLSPAIQSRPTSQVLQNVLLSEGFATATDLEMRVEYGIPEYDGPPILLPHGRLASIVREARGDTVSITPAGEKCTIKCGRGQWVLPTQDPAEFPSWNPDRLRRVAVLAADQLADAISAVVYATDEKSARYTLGGVCVEVDRDEGLLFFVATDGRRLAIASVDLGSGVDPDSQRLLIPERAITLAAKFFQGEDAVEIETNGAEAVLTNGRLCIKARLIQGEFPSWRSAVPANRPEPETKVAREEIRSANRAAAIVTSEQSRGVRFKFAPRGITLTARSAEVGESKVECQVLMHGHETSVILDPKFVDQWLAGLPPKGNPEVSISAAGQLDAVVLKNESFTGVIYPLDPAAE
jgi:DNA polymerase-3 subunit beta